MTENRCIELLKKMRHIFTETCAKIDENTALDMAIQALEEVQQYRVIGTVEEFKMLKDHLWTLNEICNDYSAIGTVEDFKALKDAEKQGLLLRFHCKAGDTVYEIQPLTKRITERLIKSIVVCKAPGLTIMYKSGYDYSILHEDFGKTVFLTKEEAEQALANMKAGAECMNTGYNACIDEIMKGSGENETN